MFWASGALWVCGHFYRVVLPLKRSFFTLHDGDAVDGYPPVGIIQLHVQKCMLWLVLVFFFLFRLPSHSIGFRLCRFFSECIFIGRLSLL